MRNVPDSRHRNSSQIASDDFQADMENTFSDLIDEVTARLKRGEQVNVKEYHQKYPEISNQLNQLLDTLMVLHSLSPGSSDPTTHGADVGAVDGEMGVIGEFTIIRELGRGGMGVVYEAIQLSLERRVALKILPFATMLDERRLKRFKNEARAAAMLKHPNIVSVHSIGCERNVHYYAMELIEGESLAALSENQQRPNDSSISESDEPNGQAGNHQADTQPIAALSTSFHTERKSFHRSIARLGIQAADALDYAHREGVIHRDIKPSNLMIDRQGELHITDFGLARIQTAEDLTLSGDMVGTLRYMSPEQIDGRQVADQRTDVYSLGLTLYELLAGRPAFDAETRGELISQIVETDPPSLHFRDRVEADLATVVAKSISKDPADRYQTARDFHDDLQRYLDNKPVVARPTTRLRRIIRWCRRNRAAAALIGLVAFVVLVMAIGGPVAAIHYRDLANREKLATRDATDARRSLQDLLGRAVKATDELSGKPGLGPLRKDLLQGAMFYYRQLLESGRDDDSIVFESAVAFRELANSYVETGETDEAHVLLDEAIELLMQLTETDPDNLEYVFSLAKTLHDRGRCSRQDIEAIPFLEEAEAIYGSLGNGNEEYVRALSSCRRHLASKFSSAGRHADATTIISAALRDLTPQDGSSKVGIANAKNAVGWQHQLARSHACTGRVAEARAHYEKSIASTEELLQRLDVEDQTLLGMGVCRIRREFCRLLIGMHDYQLATKQIELAISSMERALADFPDHVLPNRELTHCYYHLGEALLCNGQNVDALSAFDNSLKFGQAYLDQALDNVFDAQRPLAKAHFRRGLARWSLEEADLAKADFSACWNYLEGALANSKPSHTGIRRDICEFLAACPNADFHKPDLLIEFAPQVFGPEDGRLWLLCGIANIQRENWVASKEALENSRERMNNGDAYHDVFLSITHSGLKNPVQSRVHLANAKAAILARKPVGTLVFPNPMLLDDFVSEARSLLTQFDKN